MIRQLYGEQYRKIDIVVQKQKHKVVAEMVKEFDPQGKFLIFKYGKKRFAIVKAHTLKTILQDCTYISSCKNGMATYFDLRGEWGLLNERGEIICPAGTLKSSRKTK